MSTETEIPSRIKITWLIGILAAFAIFAVIAGYSGHMTRVYPSYEQQIASDRYVTLQKLREDEDKLINGPADWIDQTKGIIHIPIDEAMAKEVETLKDQPAQMCALALPATPPPAAVAPAPTAPAPPAATATAAAPATKATPTAPADKKKKKKTAHAAPAKPNQ